MVPLLSAVVMVGVVGSQDKVGLVALTSPHVVPEMVFAGTPLKCFRELDRARADIPEENAKGVDIDGIIVLPWSEKGRDSEPGTESSCIPTHGVCRGLHTFFPKAFNIHCLP